MKTNDYKRYRRRMVAGLKSKIRHYEKCLPELAKLDPEVFAAGIEMFEDSEAFALWLCNPARSLGGRVPIFFIRTWAGRAKVANILRALAGGGYL